MATKRISQQPASRPATPGAKPGAKTAAKPARSARTTRGKQSTAAAARASNDARTESLTAVFAALGAADPKRWARSHVDASTDALARFVLLRALWLKVLEPGKLLARARKDKHAGDAVDRMLKKVSLSDLDALIRLAQETALKDLLSVLDDTSDNDDGISWGVFRRDGRGLPMWRLEALWSDADHAKP